MRGHRWLAVVVVMVVLATAGCQGTGSRRTASAPEPALSGALDSGGTLAETRPAKTVTVVDRHPLFSKPREYWDLRATTRSSRRPRQPSSACPSVYSAEVEANRCRCAAGNPVIRSKARSSIDETLSGRE